MRQTKESEAEERERFLRHVTKPAGTDCWIWSGHIDRTGYGRISIGGKLHRAHRVAYSYEHGSVPEDRFVCHTCDVRACVNPMHLFVGSNWTNQVDVAVKNRGRPHGTEATPKETVLEARRLLAAGATVSAVASKLGLGRSAVGRIRTGENWGWLSEETEALRAEASALAAQLAEVREAVEAYPCAECGGARSRCDPR